MSGGRRYRLDVQYSNVRNEVSLTGGHLILQVRPESTPEQRERVLNDWYREQLKMQAAGSDSKSVNRL